MQGRTTLLAPALAVLLAAPALAHELPTAEERAQLFAAADANADGKLDLTEFAALDELVRQRMTQKRFERLDADGDGAVTSAELDAGLARRGRRGRHGG
jgi:Ca2+-binding EF-hand superfamily protein